MRQMGTWRTWLPGGPELAVALLSASFLTVEILAMRQWKVALVYDLAFVIVPWTMMGAALGFMLAPALARRTAAPVRPYLAPLLALGYALLCVAPFVALASVQHEDGYHVGYVLDPKLLAFAFAAGLGANALWGATQALVLQDSRTPLRLYAWDLLGAALGAAACVVLADAFGAPGAVSAAHLLGLAGAVLLARAASLPQPVFRGVLAGAAGLGLFGLLVLPGLAKVQVWHPWDVSWSGSNSLAQVDVRPVSASVFLVRGSDRVSIAPYSSKVQTWLVSNDERRSAARIISYDSLRDVAPLRQDFNYLAFLANRPKSALVLGSGGGVEVLQALLAGCTSVTAVEINPLMIEATRASGSRVYDEPGVRVVIGEARNFMRTSRERFDLVFMPNVKSYGGTGRAHGFLENYLLTREGLAEALRVLAPGGVLAIRDYDWCVDIAVSGLLEGLPPGTAGIEGRFLRLRGPSDLLLYAPDGVAPIRKGLVVANMISLWSVVPQGAAELEQLARTVPCSTDDSPYYHHLRSAEFLTGARSTDVGEGDLAFLPLLVTTLALGGVALLAAGVGGWLATRDRPLAQVLPLAAWFSLLGAGFIVAELYLMEKAALYLAHPTAALSIVLASLLVGGGLGSLWAGRVPEEGVSRRAWAFAALSALVLTLVAGALETWGASLAVTPPGVRTGIAVAILVPLGIGLGVLFPLGIRMAVRVSPSWVPWMWGINAAAGVAGGAMGKFAFILGGGTRPWPWG